MTDWTQWHARYDESDSALSQRLLAVQHQVRLALDRAEPGPVRLLSLCAGEGRDVLPVLPAHPRGAEVSGRLVELDPDLCATARSTAPPSVEVAQADAGTTAAYVDRVPADVLLLCGIFGNVPVDDVAHTVAAIPSLLATGGTVIWTRHTRPPDLTPALRSWFRNVGVEESAFVAPPAPGWAVGAGVFRGAHVPAKSIRRLFTFAS